MFRSLLDFLIRHRPVAPVVIHVNLCSQIIKLFIGNVFSNQLDVLAHGLNLGSAALGESQFHGIPVPLCEMILH